MIGYKNREVKTKYSKVYFNLRKHVFSVKQGQHVVLHTEGVHLTDVTLTVNEKDRQRVLREQQKNVHAYVNGMFQGTYSGDAPEGYREAYYNPYKVSTFVDKETFEPVTEASEAILLNRRIFYK
jgi:hypothetical protein